MPTLPLERMDTRDVAAESFTTNLLVPSVVSRVAVMSPAWAGVGKVRKVNKIRQVTKVKVCVILNETK